MITYIQEMGKELGRMFGERDLDPDLPGRLVVLVEEIDRLDPRDFVPSARPAFVQSRRICRTLARHFSQPPHWERFQQWALQKLDQANIVPLLAAALEIPRPDRELYEKLPVPLPYHRVLFTRLRDHLDGLASLLDGYGGPGSQVVSRSIDWVGDDTLRPIIERDYRELTLVLHPGGAWKSTVVMAGSILEALLYHVLTRDAGWSAKAMTAAKAPRKKGGVVRDIATDKREDQWTLENLIDVAEELGLLPKSRAEAIDRVLRGYRNFVHPRREVKDEHLCSEGEANAALGNLQIVCDHLEKTVK